MKVSWSRYLVAAALILVVGVVWALADELEMKVEVSNRNGEEITVVVNGVTEVITLDDLAEGEERTIDVGGHPFTVQRAGDRLTLQNDGFGTEHALSWVSEDDEAEGGRRVVVVKKGEGDAWFVGDGEAHEVVVFKEGEGDLDVEALKGRYGSELQGIEPGEAMVWVSEVGSDDPVIIKRIGPPPADVVTYRCEETGSTLTVKKVDGLLDSYIDPVSGCVMTKVEAPVRKVVRVEVIEKKTADD